MLTAIRCKTYEIRRYLIVSLAISLLAIPIANSIVIQRDRNRNEMYGEAFWIYGFDVYDMTDKELAESLPEEWGFNEGYHVLPDHLDHVKYEYPVFALIFFAVATGVFPGVGPLQALWLNFILVLVFNLNLILIAVLLGDRIYKERWARLLFGGYFVYGLLMSAGGGKLEPLADCLLLMALVFRKDNQYGRSMFALGLGAQTKVYPCVAFPLLFIEAPLASVWFFFSTLLTIVPFMFLGVELESLIQHFLNTSTYSEHIVNPLYPGLAWGTPDLTTEPLTYYPWPPALIPFIVYAFFMLWTFRQYVPGKQEMIDASWRDRLFKLAPFYIYLLPAVLFIFRWIMPWYLFWLSMIVFFFNQRHHTIGYLKQLTVVGILYLAGIVFNWPYFSSGPLLDFLSEAVSNLHVLGGFMAMVVSLLLLYAVWRIEFQREEKRNSVPSKTTFSKEPVN